jgi:hypothetical protein
MPVIMLIPAPVPVLLATHTIGISLLLMVERDYQTQRHSDVPVLDTNSDEKIFSQENRIRWKMENTR